MKSFIERVSDSTYDVVERFRLSLKNAGRSTHLCAGYGLGLATMAAGPGEAPLLPWLAIAVLLAAAGLAHDNETTLTTVVVVPCHDQLRQCLCSEFPTALHSENVVACDEEMAP